MEERITIKKESILKDLVLGGLLAKGYLLIRETESRYPIKVFYNKDVGMLALYDSGPHQDDELVIVNQKKPDRVNILIRDYRSKPSLGRENRRFADIAEVLEKLLSENR